MTAKIIDGKRIASALRTEIKLRIENRIKSGMRAPGLAVIMVGDDAASAVYVRNKRKACEEVGIRSFSYDLDTDVSHEDLVKLIKELNANEVIDGILVQLPLPGHIKSGSIIETVDPGKDVDGFHPYNIGRLAIRDPKLRSCTPWGVMQLIKSTGEDLYGKDTVVVGASNHVGRPMALELLVAGCTVTICHRFTRDIAEHVRRADIVVVAVGKPGIVKGEWIKNGAIVIDIGTNRLDSGQLVGDVDFESARKHAGWITPVPGGVGPMTVAMLLSNTLEAAENAPITEKPTL